MLKLSSTPIPYKERIPLPLTSPDLLDPRPNLSVLASVSGVELAARNRSLALQEGRLLPIQP